MAEESLSKPYSFPPIVEVIFELRLAKGASSQRLKKASDWLATSYSSVSAETPVEASLDFATRSATFLDQPPLYKFANDDRTNELTLSEHSCAWVRRAPYEGWEPLFDRLARELSTLLKAIHPVQVGRLGLRYLNRIDVPLEGGLARYENYLNFWIKHADLLEPTAGFQWSLRREFNDTNLIAIVQSGVVEPELPGTVGFTFDIDVASEVEVPQSAPDILAKLRTMRELKNSIFEAGITDRARKLYVG